MTRRARSTSVFAVAGVIGVACTALLGGGASWATSPPPASIGATADRVVPASIRQLPLTNQAGQTVDLASWSGRTIVLVPFLTLCSDICPMTTGVLSEIEQSLRADRAATKVELVELSVDPERDTAARLAAYARLTGASWQLVTETPAALQTMATYFGFYYQRVPETAPAAVDWWTGKPLTYDVDHSDGFVVVSGKGVERFVTGAPPNFRGRLNPKLERFLSPLGMRHLRHPARTAFTSRELLQAVGWVMGRSLSGTSG